MLFDDLEKLPEKFGEMFANKQIHVLSNTCNFHIGTAPNGKICFDVQGANPLKVAEGFQVFRDALKKVGLI
jgi:hypothetical protein